MGRSVGQAVPPALRLVVGQAVPPALGCYARSAPDLHLEICSDVGQGARPAPERLLRLFQVSSMRQRLHPSGKLSHTHQISPQLGFRSNSMLRPLNGELSKSSTRFLAGDADPPF